MSLREWFNKLWQRKWYRRAIILLILLFILFGPIPFKGVYRGRVIDSSTGKPIAGAVVVVGWTYDWPTIAGGITHSLDVSELLTDENGEFSFWGIGGLFYAFISETFVGIYKAGYPSFDALWWSYKNFASGEIEEDWLKKRGYFVHFKWGRSIVSLKPIETFEQLVKYGKPPRIHARRKDNKPFAEYDKANTEYQELYRIKNDLYKKLNEYKK